MSRASIHSQGSSRPWHHRWGENRAWYGPKAETQLPPGWSDLLPEDATAEDVARLRRRYANYKPLVIDDDNQGKDGTT